MPRTIDGLFDSAFLTLIEKMLQVESRCEIFAAHTLVIAVGHAMTLYQNDHSLTFVSELLGEI